MQRAAVVYVRVSSQRQVDNFSLGVQEQVCRDYCARQGWKVARLFREEGESAKTADRTQLNELLDYSREHKADIAAVVVHSVSRWSRDTRDYYALTGVLLKWGIALRSATEPISDDPAGQLMEAVIAGVAKFENQLRAGRTTGGMRKALEGGRWVFRAPLGYRNGGRGNRGESSLSPDPATADMVRKAFELAAEGHSEREVRRRLAAEGLTMLDGRPMSAQTVCKTLRNPIYAGIVRIASWGISTRGDFEPLVSDRVFNRVQAQLTRAAAPTIRVREHEDFPLRGFVRCAECDRPLTAAWSRGRSKYYGFYWCNTCRLVRVSKPVLESAFVDLLVRLQPRPEYMQLFKTVVLDVWRGRTTSAREERERLERHAAALRRRLDRVTDLVTGGVADLVTDGVADLVTDGVADLVTDGVADLVTYQRLRDRIEQDLVVTEATLEDAVTEHLDVEGILGFAERVLTDASRLWEHATAGDRRRLQGTLFPDGVVYEPGRPGGFRTAATCLAFGVLGAWKGTSAEGPLELARTTATGGPLNGFGASLDAESAMVALRGFEPRSDG